MTDETKHAPRPIKGDRLQLDFGKNVFRPAERAGQDRANKRKLPPVPGRAPAEESVPEDEILNRDTPKPDCRD
jgi:hypothetical protein